MRGEEAGAAAEAEAAVVAGHAAVVVDRVAVAAPVRGVVPGLAADRTQAAQDGQALTARRRLASPVVAGPGQASAADPTSAAVSVPAPRSFQRAVFALAEGGERRSVPVRRSFQRAVLALAEGGERKSVRVRRSFQQVVIGSAVEAAYRRCRPLARIWEGERVWGAGPAFRRCPPSVREL